MMRTSRPLELEVIISTEELLNATGKCNVMVVLYYSRK